MSVITRQSPDGDGFRHTCVVCGFKWLSDETDDNLCPRCTSRRIPTTRRLAALMRGKDQETDHREASGRRKGVTAGQNDESNPGESGDAQPDGSDRQSTVAGRVIDPEAVAS